MNAQWYLYLFCDCIHGFFHLIRECPAVRITEDDTEVTLVGETDSGTAFTGTNAIKIVPSKAEEAVQGHESAPGQNKEPSERAEGKAKGKEDAPGQNKEPGESATGKGQNKD